MTGRAAYFDIDGRPWPAERLDALLSDDAVRLDVEHGARIGSHGAGNRWAPGLVLAWAQRRYHRAEPASLLQLLVTRFFDLRLEPDLTGSMPCPPPTCFTASWQRSAPARPPPSSS